MGLTFEGKDGSCVEFIVRKKMGSARSSKVIEAASDKAADIILEQVRVFRAVTLPVVVGMLLFVDFSCGLAITIDYKNLWWW